MADTHSLEDFKRHIKVYIAVFVALLRRWATIPFVVAHATTAPSGDSAGFWSFPLACLKSVASVSVATELFDEICGLPPAARV